jgi:glycosyltransferase involved in cell wall biosynthesis
MKNRIKVLILVDHAKGIDGPHRNVVGTLNALGRYSDLDITLLTGEIEENMPYTKCKNIKIILGFHPKKLLYLFSNYLYTLNQIIKNDIIYVPTNLTSWLYAFFAGASFRKFIVGPNVTGIPGLMPIYEPNKIMTTYFVDRWIENSKFRKSLCIKAGTDKKQIEVIHHSIDTKDFSPAKKDKNIWKKYNLDPKRVKIIHVGRADEKSKGVPELMDTFKKLNKDNQYDLIYIGLKGAYWNDSFLQIQGVHYFGKISGEELRILYASSDIFFALSLWETFWFTPLEAMSSGLPIVINSMGIVKEVAPKNNSECIIIDVVNDNKEFLPDVSSIASNALKDLCDNKSLRDEIGKNARDYIIYNFSEKVLNTKLEKVFNQV